MNPRRGVRGQPVEPLHQNSLLLRQAPRPPHHGWLPVRVEPGAPPRTRRRAGWCAWRPPRQWAAADARAAVGDQTPPASRGPPPPPLAAGLGQPSPAMRWGDVLGAMLWAGARRRHCPTARRVVGGHARVCRACANERVPRWYEGALCTTAMRGSATLKGMTCGPRRGAG